jgi:hypothetical protein
MRTLGILAFGLAATLFASAAYGDDAHRDEKAADVLFQSAKAALERGDLGTACAQFAESQRLDPAAGTLLNLGECEERSGKVATALGHVKEARALLPPGDYRIPFADARIAGLVRRLPHLTVKLADPAAATNARVTCDERELPRGSLDQPVPVDPGPHACVVQAPGHADARAEGTVKESETLTLELKLGAAPTTIQPPPPAPEVQPIAGTRLVEGERPSPPPPAAPRGGTQRVAGLAVAGAGAVGLAIGTVFGLVAKGTYDGAVSNYCKAGPSSCTQPGVTGGRSAHDQATASTVAFVAGGALLAGGGLLYLTAPRGARVGVAPVVGSRGAGLSVSGAW